MKRYIQPGQPQAKVALRSPIKCCLRWWVILAQCLRKSRGFGFFSPAGKIPGTIAIGWQPKAYAAFNFSGCAATRMHWVLQCSVAVVIWLTESRRDSITGHVA